MNRPEQDRSILRAVFLLLFAASLMGAFGVILAATNESVQPGAPEEPSYPWKMENYAIENPIGGKIGNADRGRIIVAASNKGNCLACHAMPIQEESFHGNIGPSLEGIGSRLTTAQIRLRVVDEQQINPMSIMPGYYRDPDVMTRVLYEYRGLPLLKAQEVEDIVAYLATLKK